MIVQGFAPSTRRPRRYAGAEARGVGLLAGLPAGLRERVITGMFGQPSRPGAIDTSSASA